MANREIGHVSGTASMGIAVLIPALDEEATIGRVVIKSKGLADKVIVCDDGSRDMTAQIAEGLGAEVIRHSRNLGYGASLSSLFQRALSTDADTFVTLDGDAQHDPEEILKLVDPVLKEEADMAVGSRFLGGKSEVPRYRKAGIGVITNVTNLVSNTELTDAQSGFRAYNRKALEVVSPSDMGMGASTEILLKAGKAGLRIVEVPVTVSYNAKSSRNPVYHGVQVLFSSVKHLSILHPLIVYGVPGLALMAYGLYLGIHAMSAYASTHHVYVGSTLISIGAILGGLILGITALILWIMITLIRDPEYRNSRIAPTSRASARQHINSHDFLSPDTKRTTSSPWQF